MNNFSESQSLSKCLGGRNLYLVGMMGCGKSLTGPPLAKELGYGFVDVDAVIEQVSGKSIENIFNDEGEVGFREIESQVMSAIGQRHSLVVATGGGVVTRSENWGILHQGVVIWIDPGRDRLLTRLNADNLKRPLLEGNELITKFDVLFEQRKPLYSESDLHIVVRDESPELVATQILKKLPLIINNLKGPPERQTTAD